MEDYGDGHKNTTIKQHQIFFRTETCSVTNVTKLNKETYQSLDKVKNSTCWKKKKKQWSMFGSLIFVHSDISILMYDAILLFTFL